MSDLLEFRLLKIIVAIAETANFTRASERVFLAQPTLSQQVIALEDDLGIQIFIRRREGVSLTPAGQMLYAYAKEALELRDEVVNAARAMDRGEIPVLRVGLQGRAGSGKTSVLESIREGAEQNGYAVEGFAPTSRAAKQLRDVGIKADTLQRFLAGEGLQAAGDPTSKHLYMVDESSLASTLQISDFFNKIAPQDRVLLIGDTRQHQGVDAGKPFEQLQEAGMRTAQLGQIMRQKDSALLKAVVGKNWTPSACCVTERFLGKK